MDRGRIDAMSVHEVENGSNMVDWSSLVVEPVIEPENDWEQEGIPDEKPANENAMFSLLGLKTEVDERETKPGPTVIPTSDYDLDDVKEVVHEYYSISRFKAAYEGVIQPLTDKNQWPRVDTGFVLRGPIPTGKKRGAGRIRKQRIKCLWEGGTSKKGSLNKCKKCHELGHREAGCPKNGTKKRKSRGQKNVAPWFDVSVSNAVPSTPTKTKNAATTSSPGPVTRSQTATSPGPVTRSQAAATPLKSPAPKKKKLSEL